MADNSNISQEFSFEKLNVYQEGRQLVVAVYALLKRLPKNEQFELCAQLQRAIVSVPSNIAEGSGRISMKEKIHFLEIAYGSLMESYCQLQLAADLGYLTLEDVAGIKPQFYKVSNFINKLSKSYKTKLNDSSKK